MKKIYFGGFSSVEYKLVELYLNELSSNGFYMEKVKFGIGYFSECEKDKYIYCTDVIFNIKDIDDYKNFYEDIGWNFVCSIGNIQVFRSEKEKNLPPIHTDKNIEKDLIKTSIKNNLISFITIIIIAILTFINMDYTTILENIGLASFIIVLFGIFNSIFINIYEHREYKYICKIIDNKEYSKNFKNMVTVKRYLKILYILIIFIAITLFLSDIFNGSTLALVMIIFIAYMFIGGFILSVIKSNSKNKIKFIIFSIIFIIGGMAITPFAIMTMSSLNFNKSENIIMSQGGKYAKCSDIFNNATVKNSRYSEKSSILVPKSFDYYEISKDDDVVISVRTEYFMGINNSIAVYIFNGYVDNLKQKNDNRPYENIYKLEKTDLFNCDKAIIIDDETVILLKNNEVFVIELEGDITSSENINICEKIIK